MRTTSIGTFALGLLAPTLFGVTPALAQDTKSFLVQSNVAPYCSQFTVSATPMNLGQLTGATGQLLPAFSNATEAQRQLSANFYCNAPSTVTIKAEPLMHTTVANVSDSSSFTNRVDYTATLKWRDLQGSVSSTVTNGQQIDATQPNIGDLTLSLSNPVVQNNLRPVAGSYQGQVRLVIALTQ